MDKNEFWSRAGAVWGCVGPVVRSKVQAASALPNAFVQRATNALDAMDGLIHRDAEILRTQVQDVVHVFGSSGLDAGSAGDAARALASAIEDRVFLKRMDRLAFLLGDAERSAAEVSAAR